MSKRNSDRPPQGELQATEGTQPPETPLALEQQSAGGNADAQADGPPPPPPPPRGEGERKTVVRARHKTPHPRYRIAGFALTQAPQEYAVTQAQLEAMCRDPWVALEE